MRFLLVLGACFLIRCTGSVFADIPIPPNQTKTWIYPSTKLPPVVVSAVAELFNEGFADPRGCDYREIEVNLGNDQNTKTHGWVLPDIAMGHFAVGWNGLVYPVVTIGHAASLQKDVDDMLSKDEKQWGSYTGANRDVRGHWPVEEWNAVSQQNVLPLKVAILFRLNRADLAESVWKRWFTLSAGDKDDPYLLLSQEWIDSLYGRAVSAHQRGDDAFALATCRILVPLRSTIESMAAKRGFSKDASGKPYLGGLEDLPELAADQERRAQEPPYKQVLESGQPAQGPGRIAALIRDLEQVHVVQAMNPGQTDTYNDPIVQALIKEGEPAIQPLLKCWEEDPRLTRTRFTQGMGFGGPMVHAYEPAYIALDVILDKPFYFSEEDNNRDWPVESRDQHPRNLTLEDRKFLGAKIRAYLDRYKGMTLAERWFADLQDDKAGSRSWIRAIEKIAQPADQVEISFGIYGGSMGWGFPTHAGNPVRGEELRSKTNPSVSDLIIQRFRQLIPTADSDPVITFDHMGNLILALADWDGKAHLGEIRDFSREFDEHFKSGTNGFNSVNDILISLFQRRIHLGDSSALQDYEVWLKTRSPKDLSNPLQSTRPFQLMWHYPQDPGMEATARELFTIEKSPWLPLPNVIVPTPLIGFESFRRELLRGLSDTSPAGKIKVDVGSISYDFERTGGTSTGSPGLPPGTPFAPSPGTSVVFRLCDCYAFQLSQVENFPAFKLYWPVVKRDAALAVCRTFLQQYGNGYQGRPDDPYDGGMDEPDPGTAKFFIPQLARPATPADVKAGRAIFSLSGTKRTWKMPTYPMGPAWQAEEVLTDGKWERYFGVIDNGIPTKVPAAKMDFPGSFPLLGKVTKAISGGVSGPSIPDSQGFDISYIIHHSFPTSAPVPVTIDIVNHSGLDTPVPGSVLLPPGATRMLPASISLLISYSEKLVPSVERFSEPRFDPAPYHDLPMRKEVAVAPAQPTGSTLYPTQKLTILSLDLRDYFDMSHPGSYRLTALFHVPGQPESRSNEVSFSLSEKPN